MSDEAALLAAILAHPGEDTPRLAYADWLEEHDQPERAEYIRLECEWARLGGDDADAAAARRRLIRLRTGELERQERKRWAAVLKGRKGPLRGRDGYFHFGRGFPERAGGAADRLIAGGEALFRLAPVTDVSVRGVTPENLGTVLACPWLARVRSLSLSGPYDDAAPKPDWQQLADCPHLGNLASVWLGHGRLSPAGAARLAAAGPFPSLRKFQMSDALLGDAGVAALFGGRGFGRLEEVYFYKCGIGAAGVGAIANSPGLGRLAKLSLPSHPLTADAVAALTGGRLWPVLGGLVLWGCGLDEGAVGTLAGAPVPARLRVLELSMNRFGPLAVRDLARSRLLETVEVLNLSSNRLWDPSAEFLAGSPHLVRLRELNLGSCGLGPAGAKALAGCAALAGLRRLSLYGNRVRAEGALALADSPHLAGLQYLSLSGIRGKARQRLRERFGDRVRLI